MGETETTTASTIIPTGSVVVACGFSVVSLFVSVPRCKMFVRNASYEVGCRGTSTGAGSRLCDETFSASPMMSALFR
jgi:hypothetical protein